MILTNKEWNEFVIGETFEIYSTSSGIDKNKLINLEGNIPYITRTDKNNGCDMFIGIQDLKYKADKNSVITIGLDTQTIFYQKVTFYTGQNIQILDFNELNKYNANFLIPLLKKQMSKFNWGGNGATLTRLKKTKILLPVNSKGEPDYSFMENYMREKEKKLLEQYKIKTSNFERVVPLAEKEWKEFELTTIFNDIQRGKRLKKDDHKSGIIPYVSSTGTNNGVDGFIGNKENVRIFSNCLTLANSGSVGNTFYQPFSFVASDHVTKLENETFDKYIYLFISSVTSRFAEKYSFNREINDTRIKKEKILLPINEHKQPDYEYMENYMKALEYKKLELYLDYKKLNTDE